MSIRKRIAILWMAVVLVISFMPLLPGGYAHATENYHFDDNYDFIVDGQYKGISCTFRCNEDLGQSEWSTDSSDTEVAEIETAYAGGLRVVIKGVGNATISAFKGGDGTPEGADVCYTGSVYVTERGLKAVMQSACGIDPDSLGYGTTRLVINGPELIDSTCYTTYKLKVGKKVLKSGQLPASGTDKVKVPGTYKIGTKLSCTYTYHYTQGEEPKTISFTETYKIKKDSRVASAYLKKGKKKIEISLENVHKGDVFKLTYKGKTYTKKIKKNYPVSKGNCTFTIKLKKKMTNSSKFKVKITNKYKQTLQNKTIKLKKGKYWIYADD